MFTLRERAALERMANPLMVIRSYKDRDRCWRTHLAIPTRHPNHPGYFARACDRNGVVSPAGAVRLARGDLRFLADLCPACQKAIGLEA